MEEKKEIERLDSIKVNLTSTGKYSYEVKRYYDYSEDDPAVVIKSIKEIYERLKGEFNADS